ncbi:MAG: hypothetical protein LRZ84_23645 [Desertifilum sp.]|nr:hypothetical protein [Desertifilum sp.]
MFKSIALLHLVLLSTVILSACNLTSNSSVSSVSPSPGVSIDTSRPVNPNPPASGDTIAQAPPAQTQPTRPETANPIFSEVLPELAEETQVPVVLPTYVPTDGSNRVYAVLETADASQYQIILGYTEDCQGGTACRLGTVSAQAATSTPLAGEPVALANGITGYFTDAVCGANCSDSTLSWEQNGNRYTVGIKAGQQDTLIKMANSAIDR